LLTGRIGLNEKKRNRKVKFMKRDMDRFSTHTRGKVRKKKKQTKAPFEGAKWTGAQSTIHMKQSK